MEFDAMVNGERYQFSFINQKSVLVSGRSGEFILYKQSDWFCADDISPTLLRIFRQVIAQHDPVMQG